MAESRFMPDPIRFTRRRFIGASAAAVGLAAVGCSPASPTRARAVDQTSVDAAALRSAQATVNLGAQGRIPTFADLEQMGTSRIELWGIGHSALAQLDHDGNLILMLAERLPSVEHGSWA